MSSGIQSGHGRRYAIISPVRNEAEFIDRTLTSVTSQSEPPERWIIADDGSTDETASVVERFASANPFITLIGVEDDGPRGATDRFLWAAEARAFNVGLGQLDLGEYDFIVKLDGDLEFGPDYFASLLDEFASDETLGIAGGEFYTADGDDRVLEWNLESHVRGATKMYRTRCFSDIGGIEPVYTWDTLDELRAQMAGWRTRSFGFPVDHLRPTGSSGGQLKGSARGGFGTYLLGYHPLFVFARGARELLTPPYLLGGMAFFTGYLRAVVTRPRRTAGPETIAYLRQQQMRRLRAFSDLSEIRSMFGRRVR